MGLTRTTVIKRLNRPLLVTFDAFGTLYNPRWPIHLMYEAVAKEHGLPVKNRMELSHTFSKIFRVYTQTYPNYGKNVLESPDKWWEMVVKETFEECKVPGYGVPRLLAPDLINRFSGSAFYHYVRPLPGTIKTLRNIEANSDFPIIIGVVSNSDSRTASILRSFGFSVGDDAPMRSLTASPGFPGSSNVSEQQEEEQQEQQRLPPPINRARRPDFDFVLTSYDAEHQKPEREIFALAERYAAAMMRRIPAPEAHNSLNPWPYPFHRLHVGDNVSTDAIAAVQAGWKAVLVKDKTSLKTDLSPADQEKLGPTTVRETSILRGVKKATAEWCELHDVEVKMGEGEEEAMATLNKELMKPQQLDPGKLAEAYEQRIDEYIRDSTPDRLGNVSAKESTTEGETTTPVLADDLRDHFMKALPATMKSNKEKSAPTPSHIAQWRAAGVQKNLTQASTSFLRPLSLQEMRKSRDGPPAESQKITRSESVRAQRAKQRQRSKFAKTLDQRKNVPVWVEQDALNAYWSSKRKASNSSRSEGERRAAEEGREEESRGQDDANRSKSTSSSNSENSSFASPENSKPAGSTEQS